MPGGSGTGRGRPAGDAGRVGRAVARGLGDLSLTAGLVVLLFVLWQGWWTDVQANAASSDALEQVSAQFEQGALEGPEGAAPPPVATTQDVAASDVVEPASSTYVHGEAVAIVHLPSIGERRVVKEGTDADVINQGVLGHYTGTAAPGELGNYALAGHRTTYGRPLWDLGEMQAGDPVVVETAAGYHVYHLQRLEVVEPSRWQVLAPVPGEPEEAPEVASLVLTACHPKFSAAERLVGVAVLDRSVPRSEGAPPEIEGAVVSRVGR